MVKKVLFLSKFFVINNPNIRHTLMDNNYGINTVQNIKREKFKKMKRKLYIYYLKKINRYRRFSYFELNVYIVTLN